MRCTAILGLAAVFAACSKADAPPAADTAAAMPEAAATVSLASFNGTWDVNVMPEGSDSVATTHILHATDTAWHIEFPDRQGAAVRVIGMSGDTVRTEAGPFESGVRRGVQVRTTNAYWLQDGKIVGKTTARYETKGSDTLRLFHSVGTKR